MKSTLKKTGLLGLSLLLVFSIVGFIGVTNSVNGQNVTTIKTDPSNSELHWPSLFSLYLGNEGSWSWLNTSENFLSVLNGLIVGNGHNANNSQLVVIGGGSNNSVSASNAGIGGGSNNSVSASNAGIGGGKSNIVVGNGGIVVGGITNKASENGVVAGGYNNNYDNRGVVLGGQGNKAGVNSLVLGLKNVNGGDNSFLWNNKNCNPARGECPSAQNDAAMITATNGVLIGTYDAKPGIALVVNGAVKLGDGQDLSEQGEINVDENGCIKVIDKNDGSEHVLGKTSESQCNAGKSCQFGKTKLQDGEIIPQNGNGPRDVKAYSVPYAENCENKRVSVTCNDGNLSTEAYPYCYKIDPKSNPTNPVIN